MSYKFDDSDPTVQPVPVILTEGKYDGVKIQYGRIAFDEEDGELEVLVKVLEEEIEDVGDDFLKETEVNEDS